MVKEKHEAKVSGSEEVQYRRKEVKKQGTNRSNRVSNPLILRLVREVAQGDLDVVDGRDANRSKPAREGTLAVRLEDGGKFCERNDERGSSKQEDEDGADDAVMEQGSTRVSSVEGLKDDRRSGRTHNRQGATEESRST